MTQGPKAAASDTLPVPWAEVGVVLRPGAAGA